MPLDPDTFLIFGGLGALGGLLAAVTGVSFIVILPSFMLLGLSGMQALVLARVMGTSCLGMTTYYLWRKKAFDWR